MTGRNLRLLGLVESPARQPDIHETIAGLRAAISRGKAVYTGEELALLRRKLADYEAMLERLLAP